MIERALGIALRKRPVQPDQVELLVSRIVRQLESLGRPLRAYIGMRHWSPWIEDTVRDIAAELFASLDDERLMDVLRRNREN